MISYLNIIYDIIPTHNMILPIISYIISYPVAHWAPPSPSAAPMAAAASLQRFLVSAALILLSLIRSFLILSASVMDTILGRPLP